MIRWPYLFAVIVPILGSGSVLPSPNKSSRLQERGANLQDDWWCTAGDALVRADRSSADRSTTCRSVLLWRRLDGGHGEAVRTPLSISCLAGHGRVSSRIPSSAEPRDKAVGMREGCQVRSARLRRNADRLGIDGERIAVGGGSAGGHIAAATATIAGLNEAGEEVTVTAVPNALILFNPVYDNGPGGYGHKQFGDRYPEISPLHNIRPGMPPTIVFLGTKDGLVPVETAQEFQKTDARRG